MNLKTKLAKMRHILLPAVLLLLLTAIFAVLMQVSKAERNGITETGSTASEDASNDTSGTVSFTGTIDESSFGRIIKLATDKGLVTVKTDPDTNMSEAPHLSIGSRVTAAAVYGDDDYLHALEITSADNGEYVCKTVSGTFTAGSLEERIVLRVNGANTEYYVGDGADVPDESLLFPGKSITVTYYVGLDNRRHVVKASVESISSSALNALQAEGSAASSVQDEPAATPETLSVPGKIGRDSKTDLIFLEMEGGMMQIIPDNGCDLSRSGILVPGNRVNAEVYRNDDDGYMHVVSFTADYKLDPDVLAYESDPVTFSGKVSSGSDSNIIYLDVCGSILKIYLDSMTDYSKCRVIRGDMTIKVTAARASDNCLHAISVSE